MGLSDFTELCDVKITLAGEPLDHRLYHFRLPYSGWSHIRVILGGESYTALAEGLQEALQRLGGAPKEHRTDSLSAAYKNLSKPEQEDLTERYQSLCEHYGMTPTRNNRGVSHENGAVESPHGHIKNRIRQALLLRESHDFDSLDDYRQWIDGLIRRFNRRCDDALEIERDKLLSLPRHNATDYSEQVVKVTSSSTIDVKRVLYSIPARLVGESLRLHIYDDRIEAYVGSTLAHTLTRAYPLNHNRRARVSTIATLSANWFASPRPFAIRSCATTCCPTPPTGRSGSPSISNWNPERPASGSSASSPWRPASTVNSHWAPTCSNRSPRTGFPACTNWNSASTRIPVVPCQTAWKRAVFSTL